MKKNPKVITAFKTLGENISEIIPEFVVDGVTEFVLDLYRSKRPEYILDISSLRWYLFSKHQLESEKLPPTMAALKFKILRSQYITSIWKLSHIARPVLLSPSDFGWQLNEVENTYEPVMMEQLPAPDSIIELSMCKCNSGCSSLGCKCKKNGMLCMEMCLCVDCRNDYVENKEHEDEDDY